MRTRACTLFDSVIPKARSTATAMAAIDYKCAIDIIFRLLVVAATMSLS
jgi:hypothetical protein